MVNPILSSGSNEESSATSSMTQVMSENHFDSNSSNRLVSVLLNEFNYLRWSNAITLALGGRQKLGFVTGAAKAPETSDLAYESWLSKDQLVRSWILNSMESQLADIFQYSTSAADLWEALKDMYGNQNNAARVYQLKQEISDLQQGESSFIQYLGSLKSKWNELNLYRPHSTDANVLLKRADEDKVFQLLGNLSSEYEDLKCHLLMNTELPTFSNVCIIIQREEVRRKVMKVEVKSSSSEARAFSAGQKPAASPKPVFKGKKADWKCTHCGSSTHLVETCWILHPEFKPKFEKNSKSQGVKPKSGFTNHKAHVASSSSSAERCGNIDFTSNPSVFLNDFAEYLKCKKEDGMEITEETSTA